MRRAIRRCSLWVLITLLVSLFPPVTPAAAPVAQAAELSTASLPAPQQTIIPRPSNAQSSGFQAATVIDGLRAQYRERHFSGGVAEDFSIPSRQDYSSNAIYQQASGGGTGNPPADITDFSIPTGYYHHMGVSVQVKQRGCYGAVASLQVRPLGSNINWADVNEAVIGTAAPALCEDVTTNTTKRVTLFWNTIYAPLEVRLRCDGNSYSSAECTWSQFSFSRDLPGWKTGPSNNIYADTQNTVTVTRGDPEQDSHLEVTTTHSGGAGSGSSFNLYSPLLRLPSTTEPITFSLRWLRIPKNAASQPAGATVYFQRFGDNQDLAEVALDDPSATVYWKTAATSTTLPSNTIGRIRIMVSYGLAPRTLLFDRIQFFQGGKPITLPPDQTDGMGECNLVCATQNFVGNPINTYTGAEHEYVTDIAVASVGPELTFQRGYSSLLSDPSKYATTTLGPGWRHVFADSLTLPSSGVPGAETSTVILETWTGNRLRFIDDGGPAPAVLTPLAGVRASLIRGTDAYTLTARDQMVERFDLQGRLVRKIDPQGHVQTLSYFSTGHSYQGYLSTVTDVVTGRTLTMGYEGSGSATRLKTVTDNIGRTVTFSYDAGLLKTVTDLRGKDTTYTYSGQNLLLTVSDPLGLRITNEYTNNRVTKQTDHATGVVTTLNYAANATTKGLDVTITRSAPGLPNDVSIDHYRADGTLEYQEHNGQLTRYMTFNVAGVPSTLVDAMGAPTFVDTYGGPLVKHTLWTSFPYGCLQSPS